MNRVYKNMPGDISLKALYYDYSKKINRKQTKDQVEYKREIFLKSCYQKVVKISSIGVKKKENGNKLID